MTDPGRTTDVDTFELSRDGLIALLSYVDEAVLCCGPDGVLTFVSGAIRALLGYDPDAVVGRNILEFLHPDEQQTILESIMRWEGRSGAPRGEVVRVRGTNGEFRELRYDSVIGDAIGDLGTIIVTLHEPELVDPETRAGQLRLMSEDCLVRLASAFVEVPFAEFDTGLDKALTELASLEWVTRASVWLVDGARRDRINLRASWSAPLHAPRLRLAPTFRISEHQLSQQVVAGKEVHLNTETALGDGFAGERQLMARAGTRAVLAVPMAWNGRVTGMVMLESTLSDIAFTAIHNTTARSAAAILAGAFARHQAETRLAEQARTDVVTGLANRWAFDESLAHALSGVAAGGSPGLGLALIDLDRFKLVNDSYGHAAGDKLLHNIASRLKGAADDRTLVARLGGDELLVLVRDSTSVGETYERVERLVGALGAPFEVGGTATRVTVSVGLVHAPDASAGAVELLRRADLAMYRAKALGGHTMQLDDPAQRNDEWSRLRREADLREVVRDDGLVVHYQGEWDLITGVLLGAEALVRWEHPTDGLLAAGEFVPLAEERGLIDDVGRFVLREACHTAAAWSSALGPDKFVLRVNLAADQLRHRDLPEQVGDALNDAGLPPTALCLELTESTLLADPAGSAVLFAQLRECGVGLAIDDFGTGYSSILQLKHLPLTALKIDRTFVAGLPDAGIDRAIVRSTLQLAEALGVTVTAEGVETEGQREALIDLGCRRAQGFLMARPEPAEAFDVRVRAAAAI